MQKSKLLLPHPNDELIKDQIMSLFHKWISRHLVSLVIKYWHVDEKGKQSDGPFVTASSGTILSIANMWFYVTAGHVIRDLNKLTTHSKVKLENTFFIDSLGFDARHTNNIPFNYNESYRSWTFENGMDFGLIVLGPNERRLMQANGIVPVPVTDWLLHDIDKCNAFALLGIPHQYVKLEKRETEGLMTGTVLMSLKRMKRLPRGAEKTPIKRFVAKIMKIGNLQSIEGMSGGPIFGFEQRGDQYYGHIIAIQSKCLDNKYVFGCPTALIAKELKDDAMDVVRQVEESEQRSATSS